MDQIMRALLKDFSIENGLSNLSESVQFEHFTGYLVTQRHYADSFLTEDIATGSENSRKAFEAAAFLVRNVVAGKMEGDVVRTESFTEALIAEAKKTLAKVPIV